MTAKLTEFGRKLPKAQQEQALAFADVSERLQKAAAELYPDVPWQQWTPAMWDEIFEVAEKEWVNDKAI